MSNRKTMTIRFLLPKLLLLVSVTYAIVRMWHWKIGFTYFTQLSNLFAAGVVLVQIFAQNKALTWLKYAAAVSISVTFLTFLLTIAPFHPSGLIAAYTQDHCASLCLHILTPALTVWDFLRNDASALSWKPIHTLLALVPPLLYFAFVLILGAAGVRWHGMAAPYPFLNYLAETGWFGWKPQIGGYMTYGIGVCYAMLALLLGFLLLGEGLRRLAMLVAK